MIKLLGTAITVVVFFVTAINFNGIPLLFPHCVLESLDNEFIINEVLLAPVTKAQRPQIEVDERQFHM